MPTTTLETVIYAVEDGVATVTLNRPEKLNAFNTRMILDLHQVFDAIDEDDDVRCVIVTGAGRAFCAGADISRGGDTFDFSQRSAEEIALRKSDSGVFRDGGGLASLRIFECLKPVIAAVNGAAVGVGATLQLPMDIRMASTDARYGFVFARRALTPEAASSWFLPRLVGVQTALEWCYTAKLFPAQEAFDRGLVRSLHAPDELMPAALALAREIVDNTAPVSIALTRQLIWRNAGARHPMEAHWADSRALESRGKSEDAKEGVSAFLEKRQPKFVNKVSTEMPDIWPFMEKPTFR